jgi:hypothetical protein
MGQIPLHNDEPTLLDLLERRPLLVQVGDAVARCKPPFVFGIHGDWGAGKTSFLHQLQLYLTGECPQQPPEAMKQIEGEGQLVARYAAHVTVVWFEAWRYQQEQAPIVALLQEIRTQLAAIRGSEATLRLARNPNLLTLMALIHRVQRRLPHGRALLFEKITEAYLDSIDSFRGIQEVNYAFPEKKRWLARVGFEMQRRRGREDEESEGTPGRDVLASRDEVRGWILTAMEGSPHGQDPAAADRYLDYIARRSGLLLPRGEGLFAFTHLSFQEYFAAVYLAQQVTSPRWTRGIATEGARSEDLHQYADQEEWRETLVLLCELLADRPDWLDEVIDAVFGDGFADFEQPKLWEARRAELLAEIASDPYGGLSRERRRQAWKACWLWVWEASQDSELRIDHFDSGSTTFGVNSSNDYAASRWREPWSRTSRACPSYVICGTWSLIERGPMKSERYPRSRGWRRSGWRTRK